MPTDQKMLNLLTYRQGALFILEPLCITHLTAIVLLMCEISLATNNANINSEVGTDTLNPSKKYCCRLKHVLLLLK
jgi:hypothetical protein